MKKKNNEYWTHKIVKTMNKSMYFHSNFNPALIIYIYLHV